MLRPWHMSARVSECSRLSMGWLGKRLLLLGLCIAVGWVLLYFCACWWHVSVSFILSYCISFSQNYVTALVFGFEMLVKVSLQVSRFVYLCSCVNRKSEQKNKRELGAEIACLRLLKLFLQLFEHG